MKRFLTVFSAAALIALSLLSVVGCDLERKVQGIEFKFRNKVAKATEMSFFADLKVEDESGTSTLGVNCYMKNGEYAYTFVSPDAKKAEYRELYADQKFYEFLSASSMPIGSYYVKDDVKPESENNLIYQIKQNILAATYATLIVEGKKDKVGDADTYRYDFSYGGNDYSLWYDDENLVKIAAVFRSTDEEGAVHEEKYSAVFSEYVFSDVTDKPFTRPEDGAYVESPISFESWMAILTDFSSRAAKWM